MCILLHVDPFAGMDAAVVHWSMRSMTNLLSQTLLGAGVTSGFHVMIVDALRTFAAVRKPLFCPIH